MEKVHPTGIQLYVSHVHMYILHMPVFQDQKCMALKKDFQPQYFQ